jgi:hypothetical protein
MHCAKPNNRHQDPYRFTSLFPPPCSVRPLSTGPDTPGS